MRLKRGRKKQKQAWYQSMDNDRSCISKPTPRKSNMPTHTLIVRIEPRGLSFLYPYNMLSLSLSLFSYILLVPPFLVTFMVLYDRPIFDTLRVLPHALPYTGYIYIYIQIWCIFKELILNVETNKKNWYILKYRLKFIFQIITKNFINWI